MAKLINANYKQAWKLIYKLLPDFPGRKNVAILIHGFRLQGICECGKSLDSSFLVCPA